MNTGGILAGEAFAGGVYLGEARVPLINQRLDVINHMTQHSINQTQHD